MRALWHELTAPSHQHMNVSTSQPTRQNVDRTPSRPGPSLNLSTCGSKAMAFISLPALHGCGRLGGATCSGPQWPHVEHAEVTVRPHDLSAFWGTSTELGSRKSSLTAVSRAGLAGRTPRTTKERCRSSTALRQSALCPRPWASHQTAPDWLGFLPFQ